MVDGEEVGVVTSGTASPTLGEPIAMAYLPAADAASIGGEVEVVVRERPHPAEQVKLPFYRRPEAGRRLTPPPAKPAARGADPDHVPG